MNRLLEHFCAIAHLWNELSFEDTTIGITDTERYLAAYPGKTFSLGIAVGQPIRPGSITHKVLTTGQRQVHHVAKEVFGVPAIGVGIPIIEDGQVIGCVSTATTRDRHDQLQSAAEQLSTAMEQMSATAQELNASASEVAQVTRNMYTQTTVFHEDVERINDVTKMIKMISERTKIIGINAQIESAHIGERGRAFGVVANEIARLADETNASSESVDEIVHGVVTAIQDLSHAMSSVTKITAEQLSGIESLAKMASELAGAAESLQRLAKYQVGQGE